MTRHADPRPHLILIMTDQQRWDTIARLGHDHMVTPNLDRLVEEGVAFRRAHANAVTCVASRCSLFTGMLPHNTGVYGFDPWAHHRTLVHELAEAGYHCVNIGKMHYIPRDDRGGFAERLVVENPSAPYTRNGGVDDDWGRFLSHHGVARPIDRHRTDPKWLHRFQGVPWHHEESLHSDVFVGDAARAWLRRHEPAGPVFLQIGFPGPHEPWDPPARHLRQYEGVHLPQPVQREGEWAEKPEQHAAMAAFHANVDHESRIDLRGASAEELDHMRRHYYAKTTLVDEQVGRVMDELERKGYLENSVIVFCSDHGDMLGDHGLAYKWLMYESAVRVPLVVRDTRSPAFGGTVVDELVSLLDVAPTLLDAAQVEVPTYMEGASLLPNIRSDKGPALSRDRVFAEDTYQIMMRTDREKIVYYMGQQAGELYDLERDPHELHNLWDDPAWRERRTRRVQELLAALAESRYWSAGFQRGQRRYRQCWPAEGNWGVHGGGHAIEKPAALSPLGASHRHRRD